jgi:GST-like protein
MLEETRLEYTVHAVNLGNGEQKQPAFLAINPNGKIPAIVDHDGPGGAAVSVFESGAILIYLAEKTGKFLPRDGQARASALEWLMFQMSAIGPMFGQLYYFASQMPEKHRPSIEHFQKEAARIVAVLDGRLAGAEYLAGDYSIADVATYPWIAAALGSGLRHALGEAKHVERWASAVGARPAVQRGMQVPS